MPGWKERRKAMEIYPESDEPMGFLEAFERESELNREILSAMRNNPRTAPLMGVYDLMKQEEQRRIDWMRYEGDCNPSKD